jgi:hypothetical protein
MFPSPEIKVPTCSPTKGFVFALLEMMYRKQQTIMIDMTDITIQKMAIVSRASCSFGDRGVTTLLAGSAYNESFRHSLQLMILILSTRKKMIRRCLDECEKDSAHSSLGETECMYGDGTSSSVSLALIVGFIFVLLFFIGMGVFAFRGQQTGTSLSNIGMTSAEKGGYGFQGLSSYSPTNVTIS